MTRRTIRWTRLALRRLDQIGAYIAQNNPQASARVLSRIVTAVDALAAQPAMGRAGRIKATRELVLADIPYIIAYRVTDNHVDILTVMQAAQKWPETL
ncbi:addiction module toxin, RelE/StbE family [Hoeflea sp. IMCC20628]|uniref:type II toxin-antitoxin system RelE/ParE family toxin n=1 Tax=Hoeflea sp. IMCC20628 TaxID=1620421 RepID=UPI00063A878F|nr:type II toxin-antitoxin system mRNA interferase toxin, RelE/StbE family [Hoeflea sp. IMCC20628]AKI03032.1 addiction module toxin, RelE/StbE family [Hoeflea sp. IMCC20628]